MADQAQASKVMMGHELEPSLRQSYELSCGRVEELARENERLQAQLDEARKALEEVVEVKPHASYPSPEGGGWNGYRGRCHDCSWVGVFYARRPGAKEAARAEAVAHAAVVSPMLELKEDAVLPADLLARLSSPTEGNG